MIFDNFQEPHVILLIISNEYLPVIHYISHLKLEKNCVVTITTIDTTKLIIGHGTSLVTANLTLQVIILPTTKF